MGVFEMVVAIVAISVIGGIVREALKKNQVRSAEVAELSRKIEELEKLEERVQTLEAIVTDRKEDLKREIDAL